MTLLLPFLLGGLFGLVTPLVLAYVLLRVVFLFRPSPSGTQQSFFRPSIIGSLALIPPMFFVGFVLFAAVIKGLSIENAQLSAAALRMLWSLVLFGLVAQSFLGQRLSLVADSGVASGQRLVVERVVSGTIHDLARGDISSIDLYRPWYQYRDRRIQLQLKDGKAIRLFFGDVCQADLISWLNQSQQ